MTFPVEINKAICFVFVFVSGCFFLMDEIRIKNLRVKGQLGVDHWQLPKQQMLIVNVIGYIDFKPSDEIQDTVSYSTISHHIQRYLENQVEHKTLESISEKLARDCIGFGLSKVVFRVEKTHALLHSDTVGIEITRARHETQLLDSIVPKDWQDIIFIQDLQLNCIIGVNTCERVNKQRVILNIDLYFTQSSSRQSLNYHLITQRISRFIENSNYKTIEMMANDVCDLILSQFKIEKVRLKIEKPSALMFADTSGVQITRTRNKPLIDEENLEAGEHIAYLAIGTNLGDRVRHIEEALNQVSKKGICIIDTSFLYETAPVYIMEQPRFLNAAFKVFNSK